jgi:hypothetical protein
MPGRAVVPYLSVHLHLFFIFVAWQLCIGQAFAHGQRLYGHTVIHDWPIRKTFVFFYTPQLQHVEKIITYKRQ